MIVLKCHAQYSDAITVLKLRTQIFYDKALLQPFYKLTYLHVAEHTLRVHEHEYRHTYTNTNTVTPTRTQTHKRVRKSKLKPTQTNQNVKTYILSSIDKRY